MKHSLSVRDVKHSELQGQSQLQHGCCSSRVQHPSEAEPARSTEKERQNVRSLSRGL